MTNLSLAAAALLATVAAVPAHAVTFEFAGVSFGDGASVTGSFVTDAARTAVTSFSVVTAPGRTQIFGFPAVTTGRTYASSIFNNTAALSATGITFTRPAGAGFLGFLAASTLQLNFGAPLSATGTTVTGGSENFFLANRAVSAGGTVSRVGPPISAAVPEPATWGMMILGFGVMGFAMRRRAKARTNVSFA